MSDGGFYATPWNRVNGVNFTDVEISFQDIPYTPHLNCKSCKFTKFTQFPKFHDGLREIFRESPKFTQFTQFQGE